MSPLRSRSIGFVAFVLATGLAARAGGFLCNAVPSVGSVGTGSSGTFGAPVLAGVGIPDIDVPGSFSFEVSGGFPNAPGILVLQRREQPLASTVFQTTIYTGPNGVLVPFICDGNGRALVAPTPISNPTPELCGMDLIAQVTIFDFTGPGGATWSNGLRFRFGSTP